MVEALPRFLALGQGQETDAGCVDLGSAAEQLQGAHRREIARDLVLGQALEQSGQTVAPSILGRLPLMIKMFSRFGTRRD
eukprot:240504-Pyramimonas_sp.AAC.1